MYHPVNYSVFLHRAVVRKNSFDELTNRGFFVRVLVAGSFTLLPSKSHYDLPAWTIVFCGAVRYRTISPMACR